ncbi:MAG: hypothetical protein AAB501_00715 [Patescibacteria group bacterium]
MDKRWIAGMAGLFDPASIKRIQELAEKIPEGSLLRSNLAEYISGVLRGIVETHAEKFSNTSSVVVKKLGDFSGFLSTVLAQTKSNTTKQDLLQNFLAQILERLRSAEDPQKEFEKIKGEITLFNQIMELAYPKVESASPVLESFNKKLQEIRDKLKPAEA